MSHNRREFIKAGIIGGAAAVAGMPQIAKADDKTFKPLNILVLGGTGFLGMGNSVDY